MVLWRNDNAAEGSRFRQCRSAKDDVSGKLSLTEEVRAMTGHQAAIDVAILNFFRNRRPFRYLTLTMTAQSIFKLLSAQKIPPGWLEASSIQKARSCTHPGP